MPYNSETETFYQAPATVVDSTPDGDTVQEGFDDRLTPALTALYDDLNLLKADGMISVGIPATTTARGIGRVATSADLVDGATINNGPAFLAAGSDAVTPTPTSNTIMCRDEAGRARVEDPVHDKDVANKTYVDNLRDVTGSITLNGTTDNTVVMTDIVPELNLEVGDVIRIDTGAYNKLHTVEFIANGNNIRVNYEHSGNRGNGSLKLPVFTGQATVTRIAKWFNAPLGMGQAWVNMQGKRVNNATLLNSTNRVISVSANTSQGIAYSLYLYLGGNSSTGKLLNGSGASLSATHIETVYGNIGPGDYYALNLNTGDFSRVNFWELR